MEKLRIEIERVAGAFFSNLSFRFLLVMHLKMETELSFRFLLVNIILVRLAVDATLRAAAPYKKLRREKDTLKTRKSMEKSDMRAKRMARKAGVLVIFLVDASGNMELNRMQNAKGAALKLLAKSYMSRDQIGKDSRGDSIGIRTTGRHNKVSKTPATIVSLF